MSITLQRETAEDLLRDGAQLFQDHADEQLLHPDIPLDLDVEKYRAADALGLYRVFTVRDNGTLIGYGAFSVMTSLQHKQSLQASLEALYISPHYRNITPVRFIHFIRDALKQEGVQLIRFHALPNSSFARLLEGLGLTLAHYEYEQRLDRLGV
jgi:hypothetical protein